MKTANRAGTLIVFVIIAVITVSSSVAIAANADTEKQKKWSQQNIVDAYEKVGQGDAKWNDAARTMVAAFARMHATDQTPTRDEDDIIWHQSQVTRKHKCSDPLVQYITARNMEYWNRDVDAVANYVFPTAKAMQASQYHAVYKCRALVRAAQYKAKSTQNVGESLRDGRKFLEQALEHMPAIAADAEVPRGVIFTLMEDIGEVSKLATNDRQTFASRASKILEEKCRDRSLVLSVMANFYVDYAWDARGRGFADAVNDENFKQMGDRLKPAAIAAEESWAIDNNNVLPCLVMLQVELGQGEGRERMETWFKRAIAADPDSEVARRMKLYYLEPKWHGDGVRDILAFGRECRAGGNWDAGTPLLLVDAHLTAARYTESGYQPKPSPEYFKNDPQAWADVKQVYDEYLKRVPDSLYHRSRYAQIAAWAGQWAEADKQFKAMGDRFSYSYFRNGTRYRAVRAEVETHVSGGATK
ncbi:MAG: hypothetical protein QOE14_3071 [Humisphaera sp.]|nr:hypothetical protein [Humisphaera sp.]